jgi:outer membrane protein OmpA-like peptidoglycan-associated protein
VVKAFAGYAAVVLAGWAASGAPLAAQDLSDAEIAARFREQIEIFRAARENPQLGASRGLVLTTVAPAAESEPGATVEVAEPGTLTLPSGGEPPALPGETAAATPAAPTLTNYTLPEDSQVNVRVRFAFDSAALEDSARATLRQICGVLDEAGIGQLRIVGHTDASGDAAYNQRLSVLRAEEVQRFFVNDCGVEASRLETIGVGEQFPFDEADPYGAGNRRVEFQAMS